ncbi:hypothetical protein B1729_09285 [Microbacterium sp. B35-04]|uniref:hypothetical protein n=1 Tax=unclassified Microbacterium TaxID=2609290 RepID=UPI0013D129DB|nr:MULTISPECIES: hypothetical protein [unclassified Microbacterium]KAF2413483.1 hypothetical protein B1729_09285 [Microbacterium sp. B35-04]KAF2417815.1 hypothetical protein B2K11_10515 [Microbacterium sp. B35-30]
MPSVTDWISSIGSLVGALTGVGALIVAVLSYRKSNKALAADAQTRGAVGSTLEAIEALGQAGQFDAMLDAALERRADAETHDVVAEGGYIIRRERPGGREERDAYLVALENARRELDLT